MKKKPLKKSFPTIAVLLLLFLGSLSYAIYDTYGPFELKKEVTDPKKNIPEYFDYGAITDSIYCNDFFGFRIPIANGCEGNYKKYDFIEKSFYVRDSVPAVPKLASDITEHVLLIIEPEFIKMDLVKMILKEKRRMEDVSEYMRAKSQREQFGADFQMVVRVHKLSGESLQSYTDRFENLHNPDYSNTEIKMVSGIPFQELHGIEQHGSDSPSRVMYQMLGGKNKSIISLATVIHDFAFSIDLFYQTEEQKATLLEMVDSIKFHSW